MVIAEMAASRLAVMLAKAAVGSEVVTTPRKIVANENDTPRQIAKSLDVDMDALVELNKAKYPTIKPTSKLRQGTELRVPRGESKDERVVMAYCHYSSQPPPPPNDDDEIFYPVLELIADPKVVWEGG